jgi:hypothetical protein
MAAHAVEKAWKSGTFHCHRCSETVEVRQTAALVASERVKDGIGAVVSRDGPPGPAMQSVERDVMTIQTVPNEMSDWKTMLGSVVEQSALIRFIPIDGDPASTSG